MHVAGSPGSHVVIRYTGEDLLTAHKQTVLDAALLTAISFILLAATYVPRNRIKSSLHHPMLLGVKVWALAHLLANGNLADLILFGSFLAWAIVCFSASRRRDRAAATTYPGGNMAGTLATLAIGLVAWAVFALWLHERWIGVRPFG